MGTQIWLVQNQKSSIDPHNDLRVLPLLSVSKVKCDIRPFYRDIWNICVLFHATFHCQKIYENCKMNITLFLMTGDIASVCCAEMLM